MRPVDDSYETFDPGTLHSPPPQYYGGNYPAYPFLYSYQAPNGEIRLAGVRYKLDIPKDAIVLRASLSFYLTSSVYDSPDLLIFYEDSGSSQPFSSSYYDISDRVISGSSVLCQFLNFFPGPVPAVPGYDGAWFSAPDVSGLLREFLSRPDWDSGNYFSLILVPQGASYFSFCASELYGGHYAAHLKIFYFSPSESRRVFESLFFGLVGIIAAGFLIYALLSN